MSTRISYKKYMFKEMRRKKQQLSLEENNEILKKGVFGNLSTLSEDGYPYITPLNYVYFNDSIYFHCALEGHKVENINKNNRVCFSITLDVELAPVEFNTKYRSVIVFGKAKEVINYEKVDALHAIIEKYSYPFMEQGKEIVERLVDKTKVMKIEIDHITGKGNNGK